MAAGKRFHLHSGNQKGSNFVVFFFLFTLNIMAKESEGLVSFPCVSVLPLSLSLSMLIGATNI